MILHSTGTDIEACGYVTGCLSFCCHLQDFTLSVRQGVVRVEWTGFASLDIGLNRVLRNWRTQEGSACGCLFHGPQQIFLSATFQNIADSAGLERLGDEGSAAIHRKNND